MSISFIAVILTFTTAEKWMIGYRRGGGILVLQNLQDTILFFSFGFTTCSFLHFGQIHIVF